MQSTFITSPQLPIASHNVSLIAPRPPCPLYNDTIHCVVRYLNIRELHVVVQLSKQWHESVASMKSLEFVIPIDTQRIQQLPYHSAVGKHVAEAKQIDRIEPTYLSQIVLTLPNLKSLPFLPKSLTSASIAASGVNSFALPGRLETFSIQVDVDCVPLLLHAVCQLHHLHKFALHVNALSADAMHDLDFSCLVSNPLPLLDDIEISFRSPEVSTNVDLENPLSSSLVTLLRSSSLTHLSVFYRHFSRLHRMFNQLTVEPTSCPLIDSGNLTSINMEFVTLDRALLQSVIPFSKSLRFLTPYEVSVNEEDIHLLAQLPHLTSLKLISPIVPVAPLSPAAISVACKCCPKLRQLSIGYLQLNAQELNEFLTYLPELEELEISTCGLPSIRPLLNHGLPERLTLLEVTNASLPISEVSDVLLQLRQLRHLTLKAAFAEKVPQEILSKLQPGSSACSLPNIVKFDFEATGW